MSKSYHVRRLETVLRFPRSIGLFPLDLNHELNTIRAILFILLILADMIIGLMVLRNVERFFRLAIDVVGVTLSLTAGVIWMSFHKEYLREAVDKICEVEKEVKDLILKNRWKEKMLLLHFNLVMTAFAALMQFSYEIFEKGVIHAFFLLFLNIHSVLLGYSVLQLESFFDLFHHFLNGVEQLKNVTLAVKSFNLVINAALNVSFIYGPSVLCQIINCFGSLLKNIYVLYKISQYSRVENVYVIASWGLLNVTRLITLVFMCNRLKSKVENVNISLYQPIMENKTESDIKDDLLFFHLATSNGVDFTAWGFFTIDNSLFCSLIASGTTYLVILFQFVEPVSFGGLPQDATITS